MITPSLTTNQFDSLNLKHVQRISMQYESKNVTPRSPVAQKKLPPSTPRELKKIDLPSEANVSRNILKKK